MENEQTIGLKGETSILRRLFAFIIDYGITFLLTYLYIMAYGEPNDEDGYSVTGWPALIPVVFWLLYFPTIESIYDTTLGHYIVGLKVIKSTGGKIDFNDSLKRHSVDPFELFIWGIPAIIAIKKTPKHQRLGDLWADTIVVRQKKVSAPS